MKHLARKRKFISLFSVFVFAFTLLLPFGLKGAFAQGSIPLSLSSYSGTVTNANNVIDGSSSTFATLSSNAILDFNVPSGSTVSSFSANVGAGAWKIEFYNSSSLVLTENGTGNQSLSFSLSNFTSVKFYNMSGASMNVNELSLNGTSGADTTPPSNVSSLNAVAGDGQVQLSWVDPTDSDFKGVKVYQGSTLLSTITDGSTSYLVSGLTNGQSYNFTVKSYDTSNNLSSGVSTTSTPIAPVDNTAPKEVSGITESHDYKSIKLTWTNPTDSDYSTTKVYNADDDTLLGSTASGTLSFNGLTPNTTYNYLITTVDKTGNESLGKQFTVKTDDAPIPSITNATITKNNQGDYVVSWDSSDSGKVRVDAQGKTLGTFDALSSPQTIDKSLITESLTGIPPVTLTPISTTDKEGDPVTVSNPTSMKATLEKSINAMAILKSTFGLIGLVGSLILLGLIITFAPRLVKYFKNSALRKE